MGSFTASGYVDFSIIVWAVVGLVFFISSRLVRSQFGLILKSIREDEIAPLAWGKDVAYYRRVVFALGSAIASLAGALYASYSTYIHPSNFALDTSVLLFALVVIGGLGSQVGGLVGSALVVLMPELFRIIGLPTSVAAFVQQMLYGVLLVVLLAFRPEGLLGKFRLG